MALIPEFFAAVEAFEWDSGNSTKNWTRHQVSQTEAEQVFVNRPIVVATVAGATAEARHFALGRTDGGRELAVVFTLRGTPLRVIAARPMSRRERKEYAKVTAPGSGVSDRG